MIRIDHRSMEMQGDSSAAVSEDIVHPTVGADRPRGFLFPCATLGAAIQYRGFTVGVAQVVEPWIVVPVVAGSNPVVHPSSYFPACGTAPEIISPGPSQYSRSFRASTAFLPGSPGII